MGILAGLSPRIIGGLIVTLVLSVSACAWLGHMLLQSHEKRGELTEALKAQTAIAKQAVQDLKDERQAWEASSKVYATGTARAAEKAADLRRKLRDAENATNDILPDSVFNSLPK